MALSLSQLQEKIDTRNIRERSLLFVCVIAVVFLLWNLLVQSSLDKQAGVLNNQLNDIKVQRKVLEEQVVAITQALATDPNIEQKNQITQLKTAIAMVDEKLGGLSQGLISADNLPSVLQEMLEKSAGLTLMHMQTLPIEELPLDPLMTLASNAQKTNSDSQNAESEPVNAGIYKHTVVLRVSGSYFELLDFLQLLESSQWHFYWEQLDYRVTNYPNADILLRVYTLGAEKGRIGV